MNNVEPLTVDDAYPPTRTAWWATFVFFTLYAVSFVDRAMLNLLVEPIRASLQISDFEFSFLQGTAFAVFYAFFGIVIGWLADHGPRRPIIFIGVVLWSLATVRCGLAAQMRQMALGRIGVAVGEATLAPAAYSLMSDMFPPRRLAFPMSIMGSGSAIETTLALVIGGYVVALVPASGLAIPGIGIFEPWQVAFFAVGLPGLLLAPLIFTVKVGNRPGGSSIDQQAGTPPTSLLPFLVSRCRLYSGHFIGFGLYALLNYALMAWLPAYFMRRHGLSLLEAGSLIGALTLFVMLPGTILCGLVVDRLYSRGIKDAHVRVFAVGAIIQMLSMLAATSAGDKWLAFFLIPLGLTSGFTGPGAAALQITTPSPLRGRVSAVYLLVFNLVGMALGPPSVAFFTDFVF